MSYRGGNPDLLALIQKMRAEVEELKKEQVRQNTLRLGNFVLEAEGPAKVKMTNLETGKVSYVGRVRYEFHGGGDCGLLPTGPIVNEKLYSGETRTWEAPIMYLGRGWFLDSSKWTGPWKLEFFNLYTGETRSEDLGWVISNPVYHPYFYKTEDKRLLVAGGLPGFASGLRAINLNEFPIVKSETVWPEGSMPPGMESYGSAYDVSNTIAVDFDSKMLFWTDGGSFPYDTHIYGWNWVTEEMFETNNVIGVGDGAPVHIAVNPNTKRLMAQQLGGLGDREVYTYELGDPIITSETMPWPHKPLVYGKYLIIINLTDIIILDTMTGSAYYYEWPDSVDGIIGGLDWKGYIWDDILVIWADSGCYVGTRWLIDLRASDLTSELCVLDHMPLTYIDPDAYDTQWWRMWPPMDDRCEIIVSTEYEGTGLGTPAILRTITLEDRAAFGATGCSLDIDVVYSV